MTVIFLGFESVHEFIIAVKTGNDYRPYTLIRAEYGWDARDAIEESENMVEIPLSDLPDGLSHIYEWKDRIRPRLAKAWVPKETGGAA